MAANILNKTAVLTNIIYTFQQKKEVHNGSLNRRNDHIFTKTVMHIVAV